MVMTSERAKKAWITRRANVAKNQPVKLTDGWTKKNPYIGTTDTNAYQRWYAEMKKYGRILSDEEKRTMACQRARRAAITRYGHLAEKTEKNYDAKEKNHFRKFVVRSFKKAGTRCLSLESPKFLFASALPNMKHTVFENNMDQYNEMKAHIPSNVEHLEFSDIKDAPELYPEVQYDCAFLDYCKTFHTEVADLYRLQPFLAGCKKLAFTFAVRDSKWKWRANTNGDFKMELVAKLMTIFKGYEFEYGISYKDTATMVGVILTKPNLYQHIGPKRRVDFWMPMRVYSAYVAKAKENGSTVAAELRNKLEVI